MKVFCTITLTLALAFTPYSSISAQEGAASGPISSPTALPLLTAAASAEGHARIDNLKGDVRIIRAGKNDPVPANQGDQIGILDQVQTGQKGRAVIILHDGSSIVLDKGTTWSLQNYSVSKGIKGDKVEFFSYVALGKLRAKVKKMPEGSNFEVRTPTSVASVRGTLFEVAVSEMGTDLKVFDEKDLDAHSVILSNLTGDSVVVTEGFASQVDDAGAIMPPTLDPEAAAGVMTSEKSESEGEGKVGGSDEEKTGDLPEPPSDGGDGMDADKTGEDSDMMAMYREKMASGDMPTPEELQQMEADMKMAMESGEYGSVPPMDGSMTTDMMDRTMEREMDSAMDTQVFQGMESTSGFYTPSATDSYRDMKESYAGDGTMPEADSSKYEMESTTSMPAPTETWGGSGDMYGGTETSTFDYSGSFSDPGGFTPDTILYTDPGSTETSTFASDTINKPPDETITTTMDCTNKPEHCTTSTYTPGG